MPEISSLDIARDLLRKNPDITAEDLKKSMNLANLGLARNLLTAAKEKEQELVDKLASEDSVAAAVASAAEVPPKLMLKDRATGQVFELEVISEKGRLIVFQTILRDTTVKRNL